MIVRCGGYAGKRKVVTSLADMAPRNEACRKIVVYGDGSINKSSNVYTTAPSGKWYIMGL